MSNFDAEMIDTMLYGDLDLDVKLSDAITGFKELPIGRKASNTDQNEAPKNMPLNTAAGGMAAQNAVGGPGQMDATRAAMLQ